MISGNETLGRDIGWIDSQVLLFLKKLSPDPFLAFLAAFFSFGVRAAFFFPSLLLLRSFPMVSLLKMVDVSDTADTVLLFVPDQALLIPIFRRECSR